MNELMNYHQRFQFAKFLETELISSNGFEQSVALKPKEVKRLIALLTASTIEIIKSDAEQDKKVDDIVVANSPEEFKDLAESTEKE